MDKTKKAKPIDSTKQIFPESLKSRNNTAGQITIPSRRGSKKSQSSTRPVSGMSFLGVLRSYATYIRVYVSIYYIHAQCSTSCQYVSWRKWSTQISSSEVDSLSNQRMAKTPMEAETLGLVLPCSWCLTGCNQEVFLL